MRGVLAFQLELWVFGSPGGLQVPTFGSVGFTFTLSPRWGCDTYVVTYSSFCFSLARSNKTMSSYSYKWISPKVCHWICEYLFFEATIKCSTNVKFCFDKLMHKILETLSLVKGSPYNSPPRLHPSGSFSRDPQVGVSKLSRLESRGLDVASAESCREYYKGEGGGFPRVRAVVCHVNPS